MSGDFIKIGTTVDVKKRLAELQIATPGRMTLLLTLPGGEYVEKQFHERFADCWERGEWFRAEPALTDFVLSERTKRRQKVG